MKTLKANKLILFVISVVALGFATNCSEVNTQNGKDGLDSFGDHYDARKCKKYEALDRGQKPLFFVTQRSSGVSYDEKREGFAAIVEDKEGLKSVLHRSGHNDSDEEIRRLLPIGFDFSNEVLAFVYAGELPTLGYEILIFAPKEGSSVVRYSTVYTIDTCRLGAANDALSYPYAAIRLPKKEEGQYSLEEYDFPDCGSVCVKERY